MATAKIMKEGQKKWSVVIHRRIADYFKLYTTICNFRMFLLVGHRNMISVYDTTNETWLPNALTEFSEPIRSISVKKRRAADKPSSLGVGK